MALTDHLIVCIQGIVAGTHNIILILVYILLFILHILCYFSEKIREIVNPTQEKSVTGDIVLITGTGHGIGKELAIQYARLGAIVVCWDINQETNEETANEIRKKIGSPAYAYQCDVSKQEEVLKMSERVKKEVGNVTILINNAGIMPCHTFLDHTVDEIKRIFDINTLAHFWILHSFLPTMIRNNHGHIVAISSMTTYVESSYVVPYTASKCAIEGLMMVLEEELRRSTKGKSLIKFTIIYPYLVNTGLCPKIRVKYPSFMSARNPQEIAAQIINAQRTNSREKFLPSLFRIPCMMNKILPSNIRNYIIDFLDSSIELE